MSPNHATAFSFLDGHERHDNPGHVENSRRLKAVEKRLADSDLNESLRRVPCPAVSDDVLALVHSHRHITAVRRLSEAGGGMFDPDTYATPSSDEIARRAVGGIVEVTRAVVSGEAPNGMAVGRPPGHHALPEGVMGFCLFNNVAIAANWARRHFGIERIAVVDFDVHHGNGTQDAFYEDGGVLFLSIHQSPFYPGTGRATEIGAGQGRGATINVPVPAGSGDAVFTEVFERVFTPAVERFRPGLVILSAGFDAHYLDLLGGCAVSVTGFARLTSIVKQWAEDHAGGKLVVSLEGGYRPDVIASCVLNTLHQLARDEPSLEDPFGGPSGAEPDVSHVIEEVRGLHGIG